MPSDSYPLGHKLKEGCTLSAPQTLNLARELQVELVPHGAGLRAIGGRDAITELAPHITACKPELLRLLTDPLNATAPEPPTDPNAWRELAAAYHQHHFTCPTCIAAGKGYGLRCGTGAALWAAYGAAGYD